eukprot:121002_1
MGILLFVFWDTIGLTLLVLYSVHKIMARSGIGIAGISVSGFSSSGRTLGRAVVNESMEDNKYNPKAEPGKEEKAVEVTTSTFKKMKKKTEKKKKKNI